MNEFGSVACLPGRSGLRQQISATVAMDRTVSRAARFAIHHFILRQYRDASTRPGELRPIVVLRPTFVGCILRHGITSESLSRSLMSETHRDRSSHERPLAA